VIWPLLLMNRALIPANQPTPRFELPCAAEDEACQSPSWTLSVPAMIARQSTAFRLNATRGWDALIPCGARSAEQKHGFRESHSKWNRFLVNLKRRTSPARLLSGAIDITPALEACLHPGLGSAIRSYAEGFGRRSGITVTTDIPDGLPRFSLDIETALFRVTQESLTKVHRHSGSKTADVRVALLDGSTRLEISDHGRGIPTEVLRSPAKLGVGIRGMTERVRLLGGELSVESDERGTTVRAELPSETPVSVSA
jgi:hypothetical protein